MPLCRAVNCPTHSAYPLTFQIITVFCYFFCLLSYSWLFINPDQAMKIFTFTAMLSFILCCANFQRILENKRLLILPATMLAFGLMQVIWVHIFKQSGTPFLGAYRAYQNVGKAMIFASVIVAALSIRPPICLVIARFINYFIIFLALAIYAWVCYKYFSVNSVNMTGYRVALGFQPATGTAYTLTLMALLASQALLHFRKNIAVTLYLIHFALSFFAITLTQTRAAILVYPLLSISLFLLHYRHDKVTLIRSAIAFLLLGIMAMLPLQPMLEKRYANFQTDLRAYNNENSKTSIGARFAMQEAGIIAGKENPFGQSLEQRSHTIRATAKQDPSLRGAITYLNVHLHNELIDTFSLKGAFGVILLLGFYIAASYTAYIQRNIVLFVVTGAIAIYGLSDLLLYAKGESLSSILALCFALMLVPCAPKGSINDKKT